MQDSQHAVRLLGLVAAGNRAAFTRLYEQYSPRLFAVCLRLLKHRNQAEEALQDTFIRIWHSAGEYHEERGAPLAWMATIARNRSLDILRQWRRAPTGSMEALETTEDMSPTPLELLQAGSTHLALRSCINELSAEQRESIVWAFFEGLTHQQLAQRFHTPLGTVKSWIRRGLLSLKRCLDQ